MDCNATVTSSSIVNNEAIQDGGGIYYNNGNITLVSSPIVKNRAQRNGGGCYFSACNVTLLKTFVENNAAHRGGGGIYASNDCDVSARGTCFVDNTASTGGGVYLNATNAFAMISGRLGRNIATAGSGGALRAWAFNQLTLTNVTSMMNMAFISETMMSSLSSLSSSSSSSSLSLSSLSSISATSVRGSESSGGGAISLLFGNTLIMEDSSIRDNRMVGGGGGGDWYDTKQCHLNNSVHIPSQPSDWRGGRCFVEWHISDLQHITRYFLHLQHCTVWRRWSHNARFP